MRIRITNWKLKEMREEIKNKMKLDISNYELYAGEK